MSESEYGTAWPPDTDESDNPDSETDQEGEGVDETPERYKPDHLAEYTVGLTQSGGMCLQLATPSLAPLYAAPGDRVRVYPHPDGILITHAAHGGCRTDE